MKDRRTSERVRIGNRGVMITEENGVSATGRDDPFALADLRFHGGPEELQAEAESLMRTAEPGGWPPDSQEALDATGSIRVTVDTQGRVKNVAVSREWYTQLTASEFPDALFEAYTAAVRNALGAAAVVALTGREHKRPTNSATSLPDLSGSEMPEPDEEWLTGVWVQLDRIDAKLDQVRRLAAETHDQEHTVTGPAGYLRLHLEGRGIVGVTGNRRRIDGAAATRLRQDALAAFHAAQHDW